MTAQEAREKAKQVNTNKFNSQYVHIHSKIAEAVKKGEYSFFYYETINADVSQKLVQEGYSITNQDDHDGILIKIDWNEVLPKFGKW